ncbi:MAG: AAA family ATPase [Euryarchaeota archaeon]|nr:AAA family ATPase [Euryarchaeota archaeon]
MNVNSIRLENWKKFTNPIEIHFKDGLNILHGSNETGKTTLIDSIITTFYSKHTSSSQKIKSLKPWGTSLNPISTITFQKNGHQYRISKGFQEKKCLLEKLEDETWRKIAEGDKADQELIELVGGQLPSRGDTKPQYWGLGQTLWMVQGQPIISDELNDETVSLLQTMVQATIGSEKEKEVLKNIRSRFLEIFTEKKKTIRKGSPLSQVQDEISTLKSELSESKRIQTKKDELIRKIEDSEFLLQRNQNNLKTSQEERDKISLEVEQARQHQKDREQLEREIEGITSKYEALNLKIAEINHSEEKINGIKSENEQIQQQLGPLETQLSQLNEEIERKISDLDVLNKTIQHTTAEKSIVGIAHTNVMDEQALESKKERFKEIEELYQALDTAQNQFNQIIAPTSTQMKEIEKLNQQIHDTQTRLQAMGLTVKVQPITVLSGEISLDSEVTPFNLNEDENISWTANQSLKIRVDDLGEFEVKSGSHDVQVTKEELENMLSDYQDLVAPYGTEKLDDLNRLLISRESRKNDLERIKTELDKKSDKTLDELQKEIFEFENKIKLKWTKIPDDSHYKDCDDKDKSLFRDELSRKIVQLEDEINQQTHDRNNLDDELEADRGNAKELDQRINQLKTDFHGKTQIIEEIQRRIKRLEDDGLSRQEREDELNQLSFSLDQKNRALKVYQDEIEDKENRPLGLFDGLNTKVQRLEDEIKSQEINLARSESELQLIIGQSADTSVIEEKLEQLQIQEKELQTEADSIKLLYELTNFYRENTIGVLSDPIRKRVTDDLEKLLGPKYSLNFDKTMKPDTILANGEEAPVDLLSFGTQEQIWCLFRLALGSILSRDEKQLVVLDDPLVNTDPVRMHHALEILQESAKEMQIIVVTCDVDKYNMLSGANFISMDDSM